MKLIFKICEKELKKRKLDFNSRRSLKLLPKKPTNRNSKIPRMPSFVFIPYERRIFRNIDVQQWGPRMGHPLHRRPRDKLTDIASIYEKSESPL